MLILIGADHHDTNDLYYYYITNTCSTMCGPNNLCMLSTTTASIEILIFRKIHYIKRICQKNLLIQRSCSKANDTMLTAVSIAFLNHLWVLWNN